MVPLWTSRRPDLRIFRPRSFLQFHESRGLLWPRRYNAAQVRPVGLSVAPPIAEFELARDALVSQLVSDGSCAVVDRSVPGIFPRGRGPQLADPGSNGAFRSRRGNHILAVEGERCG